MTTPAVGNSNNFNVFIADEMYNDRSYFNKKNIVQRIVEFVVNLFRKILNFFGFGVSTNNNVFVQINNPKVSINETDSIIFNDRTKKFVYVSKAPPIKNLVISGGGARGVILPGVFAAMEHHKIKSESCCKEEDSEDLDDLTFLEQLDNIAGSSIGALTASLLAVGMPISALTSALSEIEFDGLLGEGGYGPVLKDGKPLVTFVRTHQHQTCTDYLKTLFNEHDLNRVNQEQIEKCVREKLHSYGSNFEQEKINKINDTLRNLLDRVKENDPTNFSMTFSMLNSLHELDPKAFKNLTVTAMCNELGQTFYFDADCTPNLDIALASRASASLPIFLTPIVLDRDSLSPGYTQYFDENQTNVFTFSDGGYYENTPLRPMEKKQGHGLENKGLDGQNLQTLALVFDKMRKNKAQSVFFEHQTREHEIYNSNNTVDWFVRDVVATKLAGIQATQRHTVMTEHHLEEIRQKYAHRTIPLSIPIGIADFKNAKKHEHAFFEKGYELCEEFLDNHSSELIYRTFENLDDLLQVLRPVSQEKRAEIFQFVQEREEPEYCII